MEPNGCNILFDNKIVSSIILLDLFFNLFVIAYKLWFVDSLQVIIINIAFIIAIGLTYIFYSLSFTNVAIHFGLISHLAIFTLASYMHITYYSTILIFVIAIIFPIYVTTNRIIHILYYFFSFGLGMIYIQNLLSHPIPQETYRLVAEGLIFFGLSFALYLCINYANNTMLNLHSNTDDLEKEITP